MRMDRTTRSAQGGQIVVFGSDQEVNFVDLNIVPSFSVVRAMLDVKEDHFSVRLIPILLTWKFLESTLPDQ